MSSEYFF